jgi:uncharacterized repeat protein (TIGR03803 family)
VFKLTPPAAKGGAWAETVLYDFATDSALGEFPNGVIFDATGALYSTTNSGGGTGANTPCCGTAFKLTPPSRAGGAWAKTTLYNFAGGGDGGGPGSVIFDASGALYGTTQSGGNLSDCSGYGCGTVFKLTPSATNGEMWAESTLYRFTGKSDGFLNGASPSASLVLDTVGALYGSAYDGGSCPVSGGCGTVFKLSPPTAAGGDWAEVTLHTFTDGSDGQGPEDLTFDASGALYGAASGGGASSTACGGYGCGAVFKLSGAGTPLSENPQTSDFNAVGKSDILWQNTDGQAAIWLMNGTKPVTEASVGANPGPGWRVIGAGDFYGSLYSDILWQNMNGAVAIWEMNGTKVAASGSPGNPGPSWHAVGTGDFNGDGYSDILWQNTNGAVAIWEMDGLKVIASAVVGNPGPSWHVIGSGDFNGDGYSDILWQNTNGAVAIWEMNGLKPIASATVGNPGTSWHAIGSGDFYGNGYSDILWQNTNGAVAIWEMDGLKAIGSAVIGNPGTSWHVVGSGDFYGDGFSDILWQNTNGEVDIWEMDGAKVIDTGSPGNPGASWLAIGECPATRFAPCTR